MNMLRKHIRSIFNFQHRCYSKQLKEITITTNNVYARKHAEYTVNVRMFWLIKLNNSEV